MDPLYRNESQDKKGGLLNFLISVTFSEGFSECSAFFSGVGVGVLLGVTACTLSVWSSDRGGAVFTGDTVGVLRVMGDACWREKLSE